MCFSRLCCLHSLLQFNFNPNIILLNIRKVYFNHTLGRFAYKCALFFILRKRALIHENVMDNDAIFTPVNLFKVEQPFTLKYKMKV